LEQVTLQQKESAENAETASKSAVLEHEYWRERRVISHLTKQHEQHIAFSDKKLIVVNV